MRRSIGILAGFALAMLIVASDARAQDYFQSNGGLYFAGRGGLSQVRAKSVLAWPIKSDTDPDPAIDNSFPPQEEVRNLQVDDGLVVGATIGYSIVYPEYGGAIRLEAEGIYRRNDDGQTNADWRSTDENTPPDLRTFGHVVGEFEGTMEVETAMFNVLMDVHTGTRFTPYFGLGAGYSRVDIEGELIDPARNFYCGCLFLVIDETHYGLSWQAIVGVSLQLSQSLALTVEARHFRLATDSFSGLSRVESLEDYSFVDLSMGFRLMF